MHIIRVLVLQNEITKVIATLRTIAHIPLEPVWSAKLAAWAATMRCVSLSCEEKGAKLDLDGATVPLGPQLVLPDAFLVHLVHRKEVLIIVPGKALREGLQSHPNARLEVHDIGALVKVAHTVLELLLALDRGRV